MYKHFLPLCKELRTSSSRCRRKKGGSNGRKPISRADINFLLAFLLRQLTAVRQIRSSSYKVGTVCDGSQNYKALTHDIKICIKPEIDFVLIGTQDDKEVSILQSCRSHDPLK